jgi:hypothetical protein
MRRLKRTMPVRTKILLPALVVWMIASSTALYGQYDANPLTGMQWLTISGGLNTADHISWQGMAAASMRGETMITQFRLGYSQEFIESPNDTCTERKNRISEIGVLWGDGWTSRKWFFTGTLGFGMNVRMYCADADYGEFRYVTAVTIGVPAQVELGYLLSKKWALTFVGVGNWNFRQPYGGAHFGLTYRFISTMTSSDQKSGKE